MKNRFIFTFIFSCLLFTSYLGFSQCGTETPTIVGGGFCSDQNAEINMGTASVGTQYQWYTSTTPSLVGAGTGNYFVSPQPYASTVSSVNFFYQKQISTTGGASVSLRTSPTNLGSVANGTTATPNFEIPFSTPNAFRLNFITIGLHLYSALDASKTYRFKVQAYSPTSTVTSIWYTFKAADVVPTWSGTAGLYTIRVATDESTITDGIPVPAGANQRLRIITVDGTEPASTFAVDNYSWVSSSFFNSNYTIPGTSININQTGNLQTIGGQTNRIPALFDWEITNLCPMQRVTVPYTTVGCCQPITIVPSVQSSTNSNIVISPITTPYFISATGLSNSFYYQWYKDGVSLSGAAFGGVGKTSIQVTSTGLYRVRVVTTAGFLERFSCYKEQSYWVQERELYAIPSKNSLCLGENLSIVSTGAIASTNWAAPYTSTASSITITPVSTGTGAAVVSGLVPVGNQIINGDFENGYVGFTTSTYYNQTTGTPSAPPAWAYGAPWRQQLALGGNGRYLVNNYVYFPGYNAAFPCADHTSGSGKFFFTDASTSTDAPTSKFLWRQDVVVQAGITYDFSAWFTNFNIEGDPTSPVPADYGLSAWPSGVTINPASNPLPKLQFYINDIPQFASPATITGKTCKWERVAFQYTPATTGTVTLKISETTGSNFGNDFGMDDISFGAPGLQTATANFTVNDCYVINASASPSCTGNVVTISATTNGIFTGWTTTSGGVNGITNPSSLTTTATTTSSNRNFIATAKFQFGNLLTNGDFSAGASGFTSQFTLKSGCCIGNEEYIVGANAYTYENSKFVTKYDHTTNSPTTGAMFIGKGNNDGTKRTVYSQTVNVVSGQEYAFSGYFANVHKEFLKASPDTTTPQAKTTNLSLYINGTFVKKIYLPTDTAWRQYSALWTSPVTGSVTIQIRNNQTVNAEGNAFVMDDFVFSSVYSVSKSVTVTPPVCALPIHWLSFDVKNTKSGVELQWSLNLKGSGSQLFIERSTDGTHFIKVEKYSIESGNSAKVSSFNYIDEKAPEGQLYYRIKEVDATIGTENYTDIKSINRTGLVHAHIYPNPSTEDFYLLLNTTNEASAIIEIYTLDGKFVEKFTIESGTPFRFGAYLKEGVYFAQLISSGYHENFKLIKK